jgi:hypothetical protein
MAASLIIKPTGQLQQNAITYFGQLGLQIQAVGNVGVSRYGLAEGDVIWKVPTSQAFTLSPAFGIQHPILPYMLMEKVSFELDNCYTQITGHFVGAYPNATPTYDYQPSFGEEPIQTHPNFGGATATVDDGSIVGAAGGPITFSSISQTAVTGVVFNQDGTFKEILPKSPNNLGGVTAYLLAQGLYVKSVVLNSPPDCSNDGTISYPDGGNVPAIKGGGNWLQMPTVYQQRAVTVFDARVSWKASGRKGWNPTIYA